MSIHYAFIVKEDLFVFENAINRDLAPQLKNHAFKRMRLLQENELKEETDTSEIGDLYKMFILYDVVHFGFIAEASYGEDKAYRFLGDIKD